VAVGVAGGGDAVAALVVALEAPAPTSVPVLLVRHALAVERHRWDGDDRARPLTARGHRQADGLVDQLAVPPVARVLSSPALRCVATVAPLAASCGLAVAPTEELAEGEGRRAVRLVQGLLDVGDDAVVCTHGDVVHDVLDALERAGADLAGGRRCSKGATWVLTAHGAGRVAGRYLASPA
jgi:phosphohistidine phosphatase SixA